MAESTPQALAAGISWPSIDRRSNLREKGKGTLVNRMHSPSPPLSRCLARALTGCAILMMATPGMAGDTAGQDFRNRLSVGGMLTPIANSWASGDYDFYASHHDVLPSGPMAAMGFLLAYERQLTFHFSAGLGMEFGACYNDYDNERTHGANFLAFPMLVRWTWSMRPDVVDLYLGINITPGVMLYEKSLESWLNEEEYQHGFSMKLPEALAGVAFHPARRLVVFLETDVAWMINIEPDKDSHSLRDVLRSPPSALFTVKSGVSFLF